MKSMLKSLMSVAVAALAFTSCSKDATEDVMPNGGTNSGSQTLEVNASIDQTRTVMAANHVNLEWTDNDEILLYIGETAAKADAKKIYPKTGGTITGVTYKEGDNVYANYSTGNSYSNGVKEAEIYIVKDQSQSAANVFAGENLPMVAKGAIQGNKVNLTFQPVGCVLVFNVYGPVENETIKSIKFETSETCCGYYNKCDLTAGLTAETLGYKQSVLVGGGKTITVTLTTPAPIGASKPADTKKGENQVYMVVAPFNYTAGSKFIVTTTTDAGENNTYTFTTKNGIDCSAKTACVVNLNLKNAAEMQPSIVVPTEVPLQSSVVDGQLSIEGIKFQSLTEEQVKAASISAYSDAEHTQNADWVTFGDNTQLYANGTLHYSLTANENEAERTAYIVIECGGVKSSAIAVTQLGKGKFVTTYVPANIYTGDEKPSTAELDNGNVTLTFDKGNHPSKLSPKYDAPVVRCYKENTVTVAASASKILEIEIVRGSGGSSKLSVNGSFLPNNNNTFTWTGESEAVVLTVKDDTFQLKSMKIYYGEDNEPRIEAPKVDQQPAAGGDLTIENIVIKNIDVATVSTGVYSDAELTTSLGDGAWLQITSSAELASGKLSCKVAANTATESRTAYIGIKYGETVKAAIAVTQKAQGAVEKYFVKVTEGTTDADWTGDYLIVYEAEALALNGALTSDQVKNYISVKITDQGILSDDKTNAALVKISKIDGGYILQAASDSYIYSQKNENKIIYNTDKNTASKHPNSIMIDENGNAMISSNYNTLWRFNNDSNQMRFRYYKTTSSSVLPVQLYKLQE